MPNNRCTECQNNPCTCPETWVGDPAPTYWPPFPVDGEPRVLVPASRDQALCDLEAIEADLAGVRHNMRHAPNACPCSCGFHRALIEHVADLVAEVRRLRSQATMLATEARALAALAADVAPPLPEH